MKNDTENLKGENTEKRLSSLEMKIKKIDLKQINDDFKLNLSKNNYSINEAKETKCAEVPKLSSDYNNSNQVLKYENNFINK